MPVRWIKAGLPAAAVTLGVLLALACRPMEAGSPAEAGSLGLGDQFDRMAANAVSDALEGVLSLDKVYWLDEANPVAPRPDPGCEGKTEDPGELAPVLEKAREALGLEEPLFRTDTEILKGSCVRYYLDETIFSVSWKQVVGDAVYSFSEVKVAHPSQFRRFLSDGRYGSGTQYPATQMAESVNAVTACSGDFYAYRLFGVTVYNGRVCRAEGRELDICMVDSRGDLIFSRKGEISGQEEAEQFVKEHDIRFSLAFGPAMLENGELCLPGAYALGQPEDPYSRAALCQQGPLHYVLVTANRETGGLITPTIPQFAQALQKLGIRKAYALDGGQTATMVANGEIVNPVDYGNQRKISDIVYFATAVPDGT